MNKYFNVCLAVCCLTALSGCRNSSFWGEAKQKAYINELEQNGLYLMAAAEYEKLAEKAALDDNTRANAFYLAGNLYFENGARYENALGCYLKAKLLSGRKSLKSEIERKIIACLERLGRPYDAQRKMDSATAPAPAEKTQKGGSSKIVAKIGERLIRMSDIENEIRTLPAYLQKEYADPKKRLEFLRQYIAVELMYDSALRRGYDKDPEIVNAAERLKKNIMVEKLVAEDISSKTEVTDEEIKYYYEANKGSIKDKNNAPSSLDAAKEQIIRAIKNEKAQAQYSAMFEKLMSAKKVEIYEDAF